MEIRHTRAYIKVEASSAFFCQEELTSNKKEGEIPGGRAHAVVGHAGEGAGVGGRRIDDCEQKDGVSAGHGRASRHLCPALHGVSLALPSESGVRCSFGGAFQMGGLSRAHHEVWSDTDDPEQLR